MPSPTTHDALCAVWAPHDHPKNKGPALRPRFFLCVRAAFLLCFVFRPCQSSSSLVEPTLCLICCSIPTGGNKRYSAPCAPAPTVGCGGVGEGLEARGP